MKPVEFPQCNVVFAKDQPEYQPLPAYVQREQPDCPVVTCWELSPEEKEEFLKTGKIYLTLLTFHKPLQPVLLTTYNPISHG